LNVIGNMAGCLANDLKIADDGIDDERIGGKGLFVEIGDVAFDFGDRVEDVFNAKRLLPR
jgi:hypothetical protein